MNHVENIKCLYENKGYHAFFLFLFRDSGLLVSKSNRFLSLGSNMLICLVSQKFLC